MSALLAAATARATATPAVPLVSRCTGIQPETRCACAGTSLLGFRMGSYVHVDICTDCTGRTHCLNPARHTGCATPVPVRCVHCGRHPVQLEQPCTDQATRPRVGGCCACCTREVHRVATTAAASR